MLIAPAAQANTSHVGWPPLDGMLLPSFSFRGGGVVPPDIGHNYLLGGHGNNTIHAGPRGDVLWGDYKPSGDPATQVNHIYGGAGRDVIYAAHGTNYIWTGGGADIVHAHFGRGEVHCDTAGQDLLEPSQREALQAVRLHPRLHVGRSRRRAAAQRLSVTLRP